MTRVTTTGSPATGEAMMLAWLLPAQHTRQHVDLSLKQQSAVSKHHRALVPVVAGVVQLTPPELDSAKLALRLWLLITMKLALTLAAFEHSARLEGPEMLVIGVVTCVAVTVAEAAPAVQLPAVWVASRLAVKDAGSAAPTPTVDAQLTVTVVVLAGAAAFVHVRASSRRASRVCLCFGGGGWWVVGSDQTKQAPRCRSGQCQLCRTAVMLRALGVRVSDCSIQ